MKDLILDSAEQELNKACMKFITQVSKKHFLSLSQLIEIGEMYKQELINKCINQWKINK